MTASNAIVAVLSLVVAAALAGPATQDWFTYHHDFARTGLDAGQPVTDLSFLWGVDGLEGGVYAEPVVVGNQVVVATEGATVWAFNTASGDVLWRSALGDPVRQSDLPCGNIDPVGVTGTPVADAANGVVYVATLLNNPIRNELFALGLADGGVRWHRVIDGPGVDPRVHAQRAALTLTSGRVYVAFSGRAGDCGDYHGQIVGAPVDGTGDLLRYTVPARGAGIWAPPGISQNGTGDLFVATGNSDSRTDPDLSESVIRLSPSLDVLDFFTPTNWADLNAGDTDLGSLGPAILDDQLVFQIGKEGVGYLLNIGSLGWLGGAAFSDRVCQNSTGAAFGATAYLSPFLFVPCSEGLVGLVVDSTAPRFNVAWRGPHFIPGPPVMSGGLLWDVDRTGTLHALAPDTGDELAVLVLRNPETSFPSLASSNGRLFVPIGAGMTVLGLSTPPPGASAAAPRVASPNVASPNVASPSVAQPQACPHVNLLAPSAKRMPTSSRADRGAATPRVQPITPAVRSVSLDRRCVVSQR